MTVKSNRKQYGLFSAELLFLTEQWIAFLVGIACLVVFLWATLDGQKAFSILHLSHFNTTALVSIGWFLTIVVGLSGVTLMRFAFYKHSEPESDRKSLSRRVRMAPGTSTENSNRFISIAAGKRRH